MSESEMYDMARTYDVPTVEKMAEWIEWWYTFPDHGAGGNLHIVLDDENVEDHHLTWTRGYCDERGDQTGSNLCLLLRRMTEDDRYRAIYLSRGQIWDPELA